MYIAKPFRLIAYGAIIGAGAGVTYGFLHRRIGFWAVIPTLIAIPVFALLGGLVVDSFDFWLRRVTRDPIWVRQHEKKKKTP